MPKTSNHVKVKATMSEVQDGTIGGCIACGEQQYGCEPDARNYECESCGERQVFGLEELVVMEMLDLQDEDDE